MSNYLPSGAVAVVGRACRLPGANSVRDLWTLLASGSCAVTEIPQDRWNLARWSHPKPGRRGRSYTWAAGVVDRVWDFDPAPFGLSPREAEQMDPQQRLLLEVTWEALEDAGLAPSSLAGSPVGVFVGASALDYGNLRLHDVASGDAYFATGNTLSIIANRLSYVFDLTGPSFAVDTACSSSLVALNEACEAIKTGRIDTAIVAGVNVLASPFGFIGFSQAGMLSPTGLCQAFSEDANGYVRAEGAVVLVLRSRQVAERAGNRIHALVSGSGTNSDGRTNGISLPDPERQAALLRSIYTDLVDHPDDLAFVEAHGTGTRVGDPAEARAIGEVLGAGRSTPLMIGSIKTNIGHTEPVSGLAGVLKAMLALEHDALPASLHCRRLNPDIPFADLNISVCTRLTPLVGRGKRRLAGISSFGFGGTNAHVVVEDPPRTGAVAGTRARPRFLTISAQTSEALREAVGRHVEAFREAVDDEEAARLAAAVNAQRDRLAHRFVAAVVSREQVVGALSAGIEAAQAGLAAIERAVERRAPVAFVFSGNGSQWPGMGRAAYARSDTFREAFDEVDRTFGLVSGWSLVQTMHERDLAQRIVHTSVAQPLIFAIQVASARALSCEGLKPSFAIGHSVGEIAGAHVAGALSLADAVRVIHYRSRHQELTAGSGSMAVVFGPLEAVETLSREIDGLEIAGCNSARSHVVAGPPAALAALAGAARRLGCRTRALDLPYPFHSRLMAPVEEPLAADLSDIEARDVSTTFISTVTGDALPGRDLGSAYWWRNVREPIRFMDAIQSGIRLGARVFVEIGPSTTLLSHVTDIADRLGTDIATLGVLDRKEGDGDPFVRAVGTAIARGADVDIAALGEDPGWVRDLPTYAWCHRTYRLADSTEATGLLTPGRWHPLVGSRSSPDATEWRGEVDAALLPMLADHRVDGHVVLPGAAFLEMALAVARDWAGTETARVVELDIVQPMQIPDDATREILSRLAPATGTVEILSRLRLSQAQWQTHAVAKIVSTAPETSTSVPRRPRTLRDAVDPDLVYEAARACGLDFGPHFRQLRRAVRLDERRIWVDLVDTEGDVRFGLDPARLDACFHGLILLFANEVSRTNQSAYVPVRVAEARLDRAGTPAAALLTVTRRSDRVIVADFTILGADGLLLAELSGVRFRAVPNRRAVDLTSVAIVPTTILADLPGVAPASDIDLAAAIVDTLHSRETTKLTEDELLLEGWATALAFEAASALAVDDRLDIEALLEARRLPENRRAWFTALVGLLERAGLAHSSEGGWRLEVAFDVPHADDVVAAIAAEHPARVAELALAARVSDIVRDLVAGEADGADAMPSEAVLDAYELGGVSAGALARAACDAVGRALARWAGGRAMRILQIGHGPLSADLARMAREHQARLAILEPDARRLERCRLTLGTPGDVTFASTPSTLVGPFDLVVSSGTMHRLVPGAFELRDLHEVLAPWSVLAFYEPRETAFADLVFGLTPAWFRRSVHPDFPLGSLRSPSEWKAELEAAGFEEVRTETLASDRGDATLVVGRGGLACERASPASAIVISTDGAEPSLAIARAAAAFFADAGAAVEIEEDAPDAPAFDPSVSTILHIAGSPDSSIGSVERIVTRCQSLRRCTDRIGARDAALWVVFRDALSAIGGAHASTENAVWAFSRTLANEYPHLDVRRVDLSSRFETDEGAARLVEVILSDTSETELVVEPAATRAVRMTRAAPIGATELPACDDRAPAARLERSSGGGLDRMVWTDVARSPLRGDEVEIEVAAAGLNFRDVMWSLSLLPEDILEDGFAGASMGLECAGTVARVGDKVGDLAVGDHVVAFARDAFASHVTVPAAVTARVPSTLGLDSAATVPVAFLTAYYALVGCARLKRREWVLVHGGAGGVGLAALQIARWRGARVIATAGTPEKRALLRMLGAAHVFDSRSTSFEDHVRKVVPDGVDVVLNSLAGEAMERSIALLRPFGRFVELGKRDFVGNTHVGLRPFRRNLTYFGVDLDQLLSKDRSAAKSMFRKVLSLFERGVLNPLPHRVFDGAAAVDAFRLMQQSGHVGKILIRPPAPESVRRVSSPPFRALGSKTHLVTGGLGGFGAEAARWLVDRGARHLVLASRRGSEAPDAAALVADLRRRGAEIRVEACDVSDHTSLAALIDRIDAGMPPLGGIIHAAMVLDDRAIANSDAEALSRVLRPKVDGAEHLHELTRDRRLDYFVLFSSATTLIGNPGQGSYVAANSFLESLARRRVAEGLPALAIAWGAIEGVGVLARKDRVMQHLSDKVGVRAFDARRALDLMGEVLARRPSTPDEAVVAIAQVDWSRTREYLRSVQSPTFGGLHSGDSRREARGATRIDIAALLAGKDRDVVRHEVADAILSQVAHILRLPREEIGPTTVLSEIGLDSLMAVELATGLEDVFGLEVPMTSAVGLTVLEIADHLIAATGTTAEPEERLARRLVERHLSADVTEEDLQVYAERVLGGAPHVKDAAA